MPTDIPCSACRWRWNIDAEAQGRRIAGVVYDPTRDELFSAEQGRGAHLNGKPIHVSKAAQLKECLLATGFPSHKRHKNPNIHFYHQITLRTHGVRRAGSAALDLCNVASGRFDGFWEFNLNPWDTAAGVLIVEEAGGKVTRFDGSPFEIDSSETLASNGLVHDALLHEFKEIFAGRGLELPCRTPAITKVSFPCVLSALCGCKVLLTAHRTSSRLAAALQ